MLDLVDENQHKQHCHKTKGKISKQFWRS